MRKDGLKKGVLMNTHTHKQTSIDPEWIRVPEATRRYGIGRSSLFTLIRNKRIASKVLKTRPHNVSGLRLISTESLRSLIQESSDE